MSKSNIRSNDLNLLPIFQALLAHKNVSKAARSLGMTQSAVSHALSRMRHEFGDDLFVRSARGVVATPFALRVAPQIEAAMTSVADVYQSDEFDPKQVEARITIASTDYLEVIVFPKLLEVVRREAPGLVVVTRPAAGALPKAELENGTIDVAAAGYFGDLPEGFYQQALFEEGFCSAVRKGHPALKNGAMDLKTYAGLEHLLISPQGDLRARLDAELAKKKLQRKVVAGIGGFLSPAWMLPESDYVITALTALLREYARYFPITTFKTPLEIPKIRVVQVWHERTHRSPVHRWFRAAFEAACRR